MPSSKKIFLSYTRDDQQKVAWLREWLTALGHNVWIDHKGLQVGQEWWRSILAALRDSDVVVLAVSGKYVESDACAAELAYALQIKRTVLPMPIEPINPSEFPHPLSTLQIAEGNDFEGIKAALENAPTLSPPEPLPPDPPPPLSWPKIREAVRSEQSVDPDTQIAVAVKLIGELWSPSPTTPPDVRRLITDFSRRGDLDIRARRLLQAALPPPRVWFPVAGAALAGLALTHLFWVSGIYQYVNEVLGQPRGPITLNALLAVVGTVLCAAALSTRGKGARLGLTLCGIGILAVLLDAIKIGWIPIS
jgi:hypothetical protein